MNAPRVNPQLPLGLALSDSARFENYFPGDNLEAVRAIQACAQGEGEPLLYLSGASGLGKTHLLQAACRVAAEQGQGVAYLPLADLAGLSPGLLEGVDQQDLVCLDDVHAIAGHADWERAVFTLFNRLRDGNGRLLVAATRRAGQCGFTLADLVSRLGWGVVYVLAPLVDNQVVAALILRARGRGLELPDDTAHYLLKRMPRDLPSVFSLLDRLDEASMIEQRRLTVPFVKSVLELA
jgi:DnaA-homolog protein